MTAGARLVGLDAGLGLERWAPDVALRAEPARSVRSRPGKTFAFRAQPCLPASLMPFEADHVALLTTYATPPDDEAFRAWDMLHILVAS
jgi:hypothetical protein